jgi:paraquat-inducible protein B
MEGANFVIPTTTSGGFAGLQASAAALLEKVNSIPFDQIGKNLDGILEAANTMANGAQMRQTLTDLAATVAQVKNVTTHLDSGLSPTLRQLPELTAGLQKTVASTNRLVESLNTGYGGNTQFNRDVGRVLVQLNEALSSIRALTDLLARDPEALIKGRPTGAVQ